MVAPLNEPSSDGYACSAVPDPNCSALPLIVFPATLLLNSITITGVGLAESFTATYGAAPTAGKRSTSDSCASSVESLCTGANAPRPTSVFQFAAALQLAVPAPVHVGGT